MNRVFSGILLALVAVSGQILAAESITFRGTIKSELPTVQSTQTAVPVAFVKDYKLTVKQDAGICEITTDDSYARKTVNTIGQWICLLEWEPNLYGLTPSKLELTGTLNTTGDFSLGYTLSVYSDGKKEPLNTGVFAVSSAQPEVPKITGYAIRWGKRTDRTNGYIQWLYDKTDILSDVIISVEKRPYIQSISLAGQTCLVREEEDSCAIRLNQSFANETLSQGVASFTGQPSDTKGYFAAQQPVSLAVNWDFRSPEIQSIAFNVKPELQPETISVEGTEFVVPANTAVAFVKTPHTERSDAWWKPSDMTLSLKKSDGKNHNAVEDVKGIPVRFDISNLGYTADYPIKPDAEPVIKNGFLIYTYNLSKLPDGRYNVSLAAADQYSNASTFTENEKLIDRYGPDIKVVTNKSVIGSSTTDLYFSEDVTVAASGGWDDGTKITEVKWNGIPTTFSGDSDRIKSLGHSEFSINTDVNLEVTAQDGAGNSTVKTYTFKYMPVAFEMSGVPETLFASVESSSMRLNQTKGAKCKIATSPELAQAVARGMYKGCTVVWNELPSGLESIAYPTSFGLQGGIDATGDVSWGYSVYFHNETGFMSKAAEGEVNVHVKASAHPTLALTSLNKLEEGVYGVSRNSNQITRYELTTVPADNVLHITASNGETNKVTELKQRLKKEPYTIRNALKRTQRDDLMAWDRTTYTVKAYHKRKPESAATQSFDLITFPDGGVKTLLSLEAKEAIDSDVMTAAVSVGKKSAGQFSYNIPKMGRWTSYLAIRQNGKYEAITPTVDLDEQGKGSFTFETATLFDKAKAVYAVSETISPYPKYKRTLVSGAAKLAVFQSEALAGDLAGRTIEGRVPFSASMYFNYQDKNDKAASQGFTWERSTDETTWTPVAEVKANQKVYSARVTEVGVSFYRIKMTNKMTNEVSYTAPLRIVGYETPEVWIEGEETVYAGGYATLTVFSDETSDVQNDGFTEWSTDGGVTWETGDAIKEFKIEQSMKILARYRLNSTDETVGEEGYQVASHKVTVVDVAPVRVKASGPKHAEIGTPIVLSASAQHANRTVKDKLITYWTTPSGEVLEGTHVQYTIKETDVQDGEIGTFTFSAYVDGLESETKATANVSMDLWSYTMPDIKLALLSRVQIAPATVAARVDIPFFYAPGVELQYQWILPEGVTISRESSSLTYLSAATAGVQRIGIQISDNRGNSKEVFEFIDIVQADPLAVGVEIRPSNAYERAPVSYSVRTNAKPGHPNDSMKSYTWLLDGEELVGQVKPYANVEIKEPGTHQLQVKFVTEYGQEGELNEALTVVPNKPPVCAPFINETSSSITVNSNCKDEDGKIISLKYSWREDGYESSGGTRVRFTKSLHEKLVIKIRATDDSGEDSLSQIEWTNPSPKSASE